METQHDSLKLFNYKLLSSAHSGEAGGHPCRTNHTSTLETPLNSKDTQNQSKTGLNCELLFTWKECVGVCVLCVLWMYACAHSGVFFNHSPPYFENPQFIILGAHCLAVRLLASAYLSQQSCPCSASTMPGFCMGVGIQTQLSHLCSKHLTPLFTFF